MKSFCEVIQEEKEESKRWKDLVVDYRDVGIMCHDDIDTNIDNKGKKKVVMNGVDELSICGKSISFSPIAKNQLLSKLGINSCTFARLTAPVREDVVEDRINQIGRSHEVRFRIRNDDHSEVVGGVVSPQYCVIQNHEILEHVKPHVESGMMEYESGSRSTWTNPYRTRHYRFTVPDTRKDISRKRVEDIVSAGIHIRNSTIGTSCFGVDSLVYRLVCTNGLIAPRSIGETFRQKHIHIDFNSMMSQFKVGLDSSIDYANCLLNKFETTHDIWLGSSCFNSFMTAFGKLSAKTTKEVSDRALAYYKSESGSTMYDLINAFTKASQLYDEINPDKRIEVEKMAGLFLLN